MTTTHERAPAWRKSSYSAQNGGCVEVANRDGTVDMPNSNHRDRGTLTFTTSAVRAFIETCKTGEYDHLGQ